MIDLLDPKKCTGCFACAQKCPQKCIAITLDHEGFSVPTIDSTRCIQCNLCEKACPQMNPQSLGSNLGAYAARLKDSQILHRSTSGGVFAAAALAILSVGGVVFGVEMTDDGTVRQTYITASQELPKLQGSKYVQARMGNCYCEAKQFLEKGRTVLFSGTPCQIAGLYGYLGKHYDNLYTMDIVCHGVPSQELYQAYRVWLEKKNKQKMLRWKFRDKSADEWNIVDTVVYEHKSVIQREMLDHYTRAFLDGYTYRESCYRCQFAQGNRIGDITMGDYWGIKKHQPELYSEKGISLLLVNKPQGEQLLKKIEHQLYLFPSKLEWMQQGNGNLSAPTVRSPLRDGVYIDFYNKKMDDFVKENLKVKVSMDELLRQFIPGKYRRKLKNLLFGKRRRKTE